MITLCGSTLPAGAKHSCSDPTNRKPHAKRGTFTKPWSPMAGMRYLHSSSAGKYVHRESPMRRWANSSPNSWRYWHLWWLGNGKITDARFSTFVSREFIGTASPGRERKLPWGNLGRPVMAASRNTGAAIDQSGLSWHLCGGFMRPRPTWSSNRSKSADPFVGRSC
jgi:hypothetical protein